MTLVIPPGFGLLSMFWSLTGDPEPMATTIGLDLDGPGFTEAEAINAAVIAAWPANIMQAGYVYKGCKIQVGQDGGPPAIVERPAFHAGTLPTSALPNNCAVLVRKTTSRGGRQGRGRMYWPPFGISEGGVDARGLLNNGSVVDMQGRINGIFDPQSPVLLHDSESPGSTAPDPIVNLIVQEQLGTQRRRMRP